MVALLRRVLLEVPPKVFARVLGVPLPPTDYGILCLTPPGAPEGSGGAAGGGGDPMMGKQGVLDVFLACIAKALTIQVGMNVFNQVPGY